MERIQIRRRLRYAREVDWDELIIDKVVQPHVETVEGNIGRLSAVPFVTDVQFLGDPRLELGIATAGRPRENRHTRPARHLKLLPAVAPVKGRNQVGAHVVHARPRHHLGESQANAVVVV